MDGWHSIDDSNAAIVYATPNNWITAEGNEYFNNTVHRLNTLNGSFTQLWLPFHGTGVAVWVGNSGSQELGKCRVYIDDSETPTIINCGTAESSTREKVFEQLDLPNGDHIIELFIEGNSIIYFDSIDVQRPDGDPLDLEITGFDAKTIPENAILVDDRDTNFITYDPPANWSSQGIPLAYNGAYSFSHGTPTTFSINFEGTGFWFYSGRGQFLLPDSIRITMDGEVMESDPLPETTILARSLTWMKTDLEPGNHTFSVTANAGAISVDYFRIQQSTIADDTTQPPESTDSEPSAKGGLPIAAIVGIVIGIVVVILSILIFVLWLKRRKVKVVEDDSPETIVRPYNDNDVRNEKIRPYDFVSTAQESRKARVAPPPAYEPVPEISPLLSANPTMTFVESTQMSSGLSGPFSPASPQQTTELSTTTGPASTSEPISGRTASPVQDYSHPDSGPLDGPLTRS